MRKPRSKKVPRDETFTKGVAYVGPVWVPGVKTNVWVPGQYPTVGRWEDAARAAIKRAQDEAGHREETASRTTVNEFVGAESFVDGRGRVRWRMDWPATHPSKRKPRKPGTEERLQEGIRAFIEEFGDRELTSITPVEARTFSQGRGRNAIQACSQMFKDARSDRLIYENPFSDIHVPRGKSRLERDDFTVITREQFEDLRAACLTAFPDDSWGYMARAIVTTQGTLPIRPGEIWGVLDTDFKLDQDEVWIAAGVDGRGRLGTPKDGDKRPMVLPALTKQAYMEAPRGSSRFAFTAKRGGMLKNSLWHPYWDKIRTLAGLPKLEFYELKHFAITYLCTPKPDGAGLAIADVAELSGHDDGGKIIRRHYLKMDQKAMLARVKAALREPGPANLVALPGGGEDATLAATSSVPSGCVTVEISGGHAWITGLPAGVEVRILDDDAGRTRKVTAPEDPSAAAHPWARRE